MIFEKLQKKQGIEFYPQYFDAAINRLVKFLTKVINVQLKDAEQQSTIHQQNLPVPEEHVEEIIIEQFVVNESNAQEILANALVAYDSEDFARSLFLFEALKDMGYQTRIININETMIKLRKAYDREKRKHQAAFDCEEIALFAKNKHTLQQALETFKQWAQENSEFVEELDTEKQKPKTVFMTRQESIGYRLEPLGGELPPVITPEEFARLQKTGQIHIDSQGRVRSKKQRANQNSSIGDEPAPVITPKEFARLQQLGQETKRTQKSFLEKIVGFFFSN